MKYLPLIIFLAACSPKVINTTKTTERDSLGVKLVFIQDTVRIKGDSIIAVIHERDTIIVEKQGRAELDIVKKNGRTTTKCKCDSIQKALNIAINDTTRYKFKETTVTKTIFKNRDKTGFEKFCLWFTLICGGGIVLLIGMKLRSVIV